MRTRAQRFVLGGVIALLYLYCFPYFEGMRSANELPRIYLTMSMVDEGTFAIDTGVERWGKTVDVSPSGGHFYSNKAPGSSLLAAPAYAFLKATKSMTGTEPTLAELTWTFRFATGIVPTLLFLILLWQFLGRFAASPETRRVLLVGYALGSMAMTYSILFIAHQLAAVCIATAYILTVWVVEEKLDRRWLLAVGLTAGCAPLVDYQAAFAGVPIAVYLIAKVWKWGKSERWKAIGLAYLGCIPPIATLLIYHWQAFGSPFRTGYAASESFAHFHQRGLLGMDELRLEAFYGSLFAPDNGLLIFCPMLLLALPGWYLLARRKQWWHFGVTLSIAIIYITFISSLVFWRGGWQLGPRYVTAMLPFLLVPIAVTLSWCERRWLLRGLAQGLIGVGVVVYSLSAAVFPHFPEKFKNPLFELVFPLLIEGHIPYNAGWLLGLRGIPSLVPYLLLLMALLVWLACPRREQWKSAAVSACVVIALVSLYSLFPDGGVKAETAYRWVVSVIP